MNKSPAPDGNPPKLRDDEFPEDYMFRRDPLANPIDIPVFVRAWPDDEWTEESLSSIPDEWTMFTKRTNYPKLGWIISELKAREIACRFAEHESWHAPILEVDASRIDEAWEILAGEVDDIPDDDPRYASYWREKP